MNVTAGSLRALFDRLDETAISRMSEYGVLTLRVSLRIVFVRFGLLKVVGASPVYDLVANTVYVYPRRSSLSRFWASGR